MKKTGKKKKAVVAEISNCHSPLSYLLNNRRLTLLRAVTQNSISKPSLQLGIVKRLSSDSEMQTEVLHVMSKKSS